MSHCDGAADELTGEDDNDTQKWSAGSVGVAGAGSGDGEGDDEDMEDTRTHTIANENK